MMKELGRVDDLQDGELRIFDGAYGSVVVARLGPTFFAVHNECGHLPERLDGAELEGDCLRCPHHGCGFSVKDGRILVDMGFLRLEPLAPISLRVQDGIAWLTE